MLAMMPVVSSYWEGGQPNILNSEEYPSIYINYLYMYIQIA